MRESGGNSGIRALALALPFFLACTPAQAHPHVWITAEITFAASEGQLREIRHVWRFDELFSEFLTTEFDGDGDGRFSTEETTRLADEAFSLLAETDYLSDLRVGERRIPLQTATGLVATINPDSHFVTYHFTLPLLEPVSLADGIRLALYEETFYVDIGLAGPEAVDFDGTSACSAEVGVDSDFELLGGLFHPPVIRLTCVSS
ncbi:DUF1007 family protein [Geminicoccus flavidas]|uniref:DUF1007 family protein n=1 Tax=Geminicoccus flavidas TaxID=2506407 RepID=UPI00135AA924|nr:DUF1007 family protein [Geminicoccus flavidas]